MSASLVGSEMCIRDSCRPAAWRAAGTSAPRPPSGARGILPIISRRPVSYTHLTLPTICSV
eukprot:2393430-Alexandrium_andersonii.AAC.1